MKNPIFAVVLLLAALVSACDTEAVIEPVQTDSAVPVADKAATNLKTIVINEVIGDADGVAQLYLATGEVSYFMVDGPLASGFCDGYAIHSYMSGTITPLPNDQALWSFEGSNVESLCLSGSPSPLSLSCPILGRNDGAILHLDFSVTTSAMVLDEAWIEVPDITPVGS